MKYCVQVSLRLVKTVESSAQTNINVWHFLFPLSVLFFFKHKVTCILQKNRACYCLQIPVTTECSFPGYIMSSIRRDFSHVIFNLVCYRLRKTELVLLFQCSYVDLKSLSSNIRSNFFLVCRSSQAFLSKLHLQ